VSRIAVTTTAAIAITARPSRRPIRSTSRCSGVRASAVRPSRRATFPISLAMPVAVTTARPRPRVTAVPAKTMLRRSPSAVGPRSGRTSFRTASLSPVSAASAMVSDAAWASRASAPTASPSARSRTSPGTRSVAGTRCSRPSRITPALGAAMRCSAATACSARASCTYPRMPLSATIAEITMASNGTPSAPSTSQATSETATAASRR
jgi:hypothetical protein